MAYYPKEKSTVAKKSTRGRASARIIVSGHGDSNCWDAFRKLLPALKTFAVSLGSRRRPRALRHIRYGGRLKIIAASGDAFIVDVLPLSSSDSEQLIAAFTGLLARRLRQAIRTVEIQFL